MTSSPSFSPLVTAISPTPAGEGKTTTTVGLGDALNKIGKNALICLREPSLGPVFGVKGGGTGGHNGLGDIAECLGTKDFWRLRIGIGHPRESGGEVIDFVLHPPRKEEAVLIEDSIERSLELWPLIASGDMEGAMLRLHSKPGAKAPKPRPAPAGPEGKP